MNGRPAVRADSTDLASTSRRDAPGGRGEGEGEGEGRRRRERPGPDVVLIMHRGDFTR